MLTGFMVGYIPQYYYIAYTFVSYLVEPLQSVLIINEVCRICMCIDRYNPHILIVHTLILYNPEHFRDLVKFLSIPFAESCSTHRLSLVFLQENKLSLFFTRLLLLYNISDPCLSVAALL